MASLQQKTSEDMQHIVKEWVASGYLHQGDLFVIGCSTSEIAGEKIGTSGSENIAEAVLNKLKNLQEKTGVHLAFQCCEHLNRSLVVERNTVKQFQLSEVSAVPVPEAGGSMASYAYKHMDHPVLVEHIQASAGIDIGETMIGMHLKHVAVPVRLEKRWVGNARLTAARTRPKLIGGERAKYTDTSANNSCK
ncbi:TIGR01440 family protein [Virgibacillus kimchii]